MTFRYMMAAAGRCEACEGYCSPEGAWLGARLSEVLGIQPGLSRLGEQQTATQRPAEKKKKAQQTS